MKQVPAVLFSALKTQSLIFYLKSSVSAGIYSRRQAPLRSTLIGHTTLLCHFAESLTNVSIAEQIFKRLNEAYEIAVFAVASDRAAPDFG